MAFRVKHHDYSDISAEDAELTIASIENVDHDEYENCVYMYVDVDHPELKEYVVKIVIQHNAKYEIENEVYETVEHHVEPGKTFDLSSLVSEAYLTHPTDSYIPNDSDLIDVAKEKVNYLDVSINDTIRGLETEEWSLRVDE